MWYTEEEFANEQVRSRKVSPETFCHVMHHFGINICFVVNNVIEFCLPYICGYRYRSRCFVYIFLLTSSNRILVTADKPGLCPIYVKLIKASMAWITDSVGISIAKKR